MQATLPTDLTDDELANDWTFSELEIVEVCRGRGDDNRHSFAIQLCVLRRYGRFLGDEYGSVPIQILNHSGRQLGVSPMLFATAPAPKQTDTAHERRLGEHIGFSTFDETARNDGLADVVPVATARRSPWNEVLSDAPSLVPRSHHTAHRLGLV